MPDNSALKTARLPLRLVSCPTEPAALSVVTTTTFPPELIEAVAERVAEMLADSLPREDAAASPYLTVPEAAQYIRAGSRQRIDDLLSQGRLTRIKDGRRTLIAREELGRYLAGEKTGRFAPGARTSRDASARRRHAA